MDIFNIKKKVMVIVIWDVYFRVMKYKLWLLRMYIFNDFLSEYCDGRIVRFIMI